MIDKDQEQADIVFALKHGFNPKEVAVQIEPVNENSVHCIMRLDNGLDDSKQKLVDITLTYKWGIIYQDGIDLKHTTPQTTLWIHNLSIPNFPNTDTDLHGLTESQFEFDGNWTDKEKDEFEVDWIENNVDADKIYDYKTWIEDTPVKYNIVNKKTAAWVVMNWKP